MYLLNGKEYVAKFRYTSWRIFMSIFLLIVISNMLIFGTLKENMFGGILIFCIIVIILNIFDKKIFSRIIINKDALIYKTDSFLSIILKIYKIFPYKDFNYTIYFSYQKEMKKYSSLYIINGKGKRLLRLKVNDIKDFRNLVEILIKYNPKVQIKNIEDVIKEEGILKAILR